MAGLWKEYLETLLWYSLAGTYSENDIYVAPSWSWADAKGRFGYKEIVFTEWRASPHDAECIEFLLTNRTGTWETAYNVLGQLPRGSCLILSAYTKEVTYMQKEGVVVDLSKPAADGVVERFGTAILSGTSGVDINKALVACTAVRILEIENPYDGRQAFFLLIMKAKGRQRDHGTYLLGEDWVRIGMEYTDYYIHQRTKEAPLGAF